MAIGVHNQPKPREIYSKFFRVARTNTTPSIFAFLPKGAIPVGVYIIGGQNSNAGSTAVLNVGTTSGGTDIVSGVSVTSAANGFRLVAGAMAGSTVSTGYATDMPIWANYAETGTASTTGGPWGVRLEYIMTGPGEDLFS